MHFLHSSRSIRVFPCRARLTDVETTQRIHKARNIVRHIQELVPYDPATFNSAVLIWNSISDIPVEKRVELLNLLNRNDIEKLWKISAGRYVKLKGPLGALDSYSVLADFPTEPNQIIRFKGRASTSAQFLGWDRFEKLVCLDSDSLEFYGRTIMPNVPFSDVLSPLYFHVTTKLIRIPATGELSEVQFAFQDVDDLNQQISEIPKGWPNLKDPLFPFHGGLTDYLRPFGPGCYVGVGWREPRIEFNDLGRRFVTFILIKDYSS